MKYVGNIIRLTNRNEDCVFDDMSTNFTPQLKDLDNVWIIFNGRKCMLKITEVIPLILNQAKFVWQLISIPSVLVFWNAEFKMPNHIFDYF